MKDCMHSFVVKMAARSSTKFVYRCTKSALNLDFTLSSGQSFRWNKTADGTWVGVIKNQVWKLSQDSAGNISCEVYSDLKKRKTSTSEQKNRSRKRPRVDHETDLIDTNSANSDGVKKLSENHHTGDSKFSGDALGSSDYVSVFTNYFQLNVDLEGLYSKWEEVDENFKSKGSKLAGVRIMSQDPLETVFSFICSSNNNIPRIKSMVEKLCSYYGDKIVEIDDQSYYTFPSVHSLANPKVEVHLRKLGFGYRAKFINKCAQYILDNHSTDWLNELRNVPYEEAHSCLKLFPGVGAKVADCICLMALDKPQAIPVDTHVWQIATKDYLPHLKNTKSLTDRVYKEIGDFFRLKFGDYAGWAHSVLFCAELKLFKTELNTKSLKDGGKAA